MRGHRARDTIPETAPRARRGARVDRSTHHRTTALARAARARYGTVHFYILNFSTFSAACMEWRDGRATRSKNARMVMEPCLLMFPPPWWLLLASLGIFYWRSFCYHRVTILSSFSAHQTPRSAPNMTQKTPDDARMVLEHPICGFCIWWQTCSLSASSSTSSAASVTILRDLLSAQLLLPSLGIYYQRSSCYHPVTILSSVLARQTPCSAPNRTKKTPIDASSQATSVGTDPNPRGWWVEPQYTKM